MIHQWLRTMVACSYNNSEPVNDHEHIMQMQPIHGKLYDIAFARSSPVYG